MSRRIHPTLPLISLALLGLAVTAQALPAAEVPAPRAWLERVGATGVRVSWIGVPGRTHRVLRNDDEVAELSWPRRDFVDRGLQPRTLYTYTVEAVGAGTSTPERLVTGPENEIDPASGRYDAVVYGGTPGGIAAALLLGRRGHRVALIEPSAFIGGMITGGLSRTDFGSIHALGGLFKQFMDEVLAHYVATDGPDSDNVKLARDGLYFEPQVARAIFLRWLAETPNLTVMRQAHLVGVITHDRRAGAVLLNDRRDGTRITLTADVFIDASYEGDLAAYAGASYLIGRESRDAYNEEHAGELWWDVWERRVVQVVGTGDRKVQAYYYRLCLTRDPDRRLPPPPPRIYDRQRYLGLVPDIEAGKLNTLKDVLSILPLPEAKADANNHPQGNPSSDLVGGADLYPEARWADREIIEAAHIDHILGLLWFLRHDPAVPAAFRQDAKQWGLTHDEFPELDGWSSQLYVREGRRILGGHLFTEQDARARPGGTRPPNKRDSIAVGAYPIDSHATGGRHPDHPDWLEGFFYLARGETQPYQIPYRAMLPNGIDGVLVSGSVSSTHIGYGTLRMEPVFMALGTAAGVAADHALKLGIPPRLVSLSHIQQDLMDLDQVITVFEDISLDTVGRDGLNYLGTFDLFPTYQAEPEKAMDPAEVRAWVAAMPWAEAGLPVPALAFSGGMVQETELHHSLTTALASAGAPPLGFDATPNTVLTRSRAAAMLWSAFSTTLAQQEAALAQPRP